MAKTVNCGFCGKELKSGFLSGDATYIELGTLTNSVQVTCCEDCLEEYKPTRKINKHRFGLKYHNLRITTKKKYSDKEKGEMYLTYIKEQDEQIAKAGLELPENIIGCFAFNSRGYFTVREFGKGMENEDVSAKKMVKSLEKAQDSDCAMFDKNDITRIEYAKIGWGDFVGLFSKAYSYAIRLNDDTVMTYKPCLTRTAVLGNGFAFGYEKSAEKQLLKVLNTFKEAIGSDLPIVKVKKI